MASTEVLPRLDNLRIGICAARAGTRTSPHAEGEQESTALGSAYNQQPAVENSATLCSPTPPGDTGRNGIRTRNTSRDIQAGPPYQASQDMTQKTENELRGEPDMDGLVIGQKSRGPRRSVGFHIDVEAVDNLQGSTPGPGLTQKFRSSTRGRSMIDEMLDKENCSIHRRRSSDSMRSRYNPFAREHPSTNKLHTEIYNGGEGPNDAMLATLDEVVQGSSLSDEQKYSPPDSTSPASDESPPTLCMSSHRSFAAIMSSSPVQLPPLRETGSWPGPGRQTINRMKGHTMDRTGGVRRGSRRSSTRSGSSSMSPAGAFLSQWSRDEASSFAEPDDEGQEIGGPGMSQYIIGKQIGYGGSSVVKEVFTMEGGKSVRRAVKIVRKVVAGKSEDENDRLQNEFEQEIAIWRFLRHPHILPLLCVFNTDYATFCITKVSIGGTLFDLVKKSRSSHRKGLPRDCARRYVYQLSTAIRYLHEDVHVVHRDIKLENCLVNMPDNAAVEQGGTLLLCDFGMAAFSDGGRNSPDPRDGRPCRYIGPSGTSTSIGGSLQYASPELLNSSLPLYSTAVDMWALGVLVFALLVGDLPFQHSFHPKLQAMILRGEWDTAALRNAVGPIEDEQGPFDVVAGCLQMDPEQRWTISDVLRSSWLEGGDGQLSQNQANWVDR